MTKTEVTGGWITTCQREICQGRKRNTGINGGVSSSSTFAILSETGSAMCVSYASRIFSTVIGRLRRQMSLTRTHHATVVGPIRFSNRSNNCRVCKINGRRSSLVRTHHATIVFSSSLRPTEDNNRMVCAGLLGLRNACRKKNCLYKKFLQNRTNTAEMKYKAYKNKLTSVLRNCEKNYYIKLLEQEKKKREGYLEDFEYNYQ